MGVIRHSGSSGLLFLGLYQHNCHNRTLVLYYPSSQYAPLPVKIPSWILLTPPHGKKTRRIIVPLGSSGTNARAEHFPYLVHHRPIHQLPYYRTTNLEPGFPSRWTGMNKNLRFSYHFPALVGKKGNKCDSTGKCLRPVFLIGILV
jgi:hypothetical protein